MDDSDSWNELEDTEVERAGLFDTMFTSPDFVKADERQAIYRRTDSGECDKVYSFSPAEHNKPVSVFLDQHSQELAFPNIFGVLQDQKVIRQQFVTLTLLSQNSGKETDVLCLC